MTIKQIQTWARAYRSATGRWPSAESGPIAEAPALGETWMAIDLVLRFGHRGLPGDSRWPGSGARPDNNGNGLLAKFLRLRSPSPSKKAS